MIDPQIQFTPEQLRQISEYVFSYGIDFAKSIGSDKILNNRLSLTRAKLTLAKGHKIVSVDTTSNAITITLPDAKSLLGHEYIIRFAVDGAHDLTVNTDGTDVFQGTAGAGNDSALFEDANDFLHIIASDDNVWLVLNEKGGTYS